MIKVYIAAPFFNEFQLEEVQNVEKILKEANINFHSPRSVGVLKDMNKEERLSSMKRIFDSNLYEMDKCTHMIAILNDRDVGVLVEFGYFLKSSKPIVFYADNIKFVSVMLAQGCSAICTDKAKLLDALSGNYTEQVGDTN